MGPAKSSKDAYLELIAKSKREKAIKRKASENQKAFTDDLDAKFYEMRSEIMSTKRTRGEKTVEDDDGLDLPEAGCTSTLYFVLFFFHYNIP